MPKFIISSNLLLTIRKHANKVCSYVKYIVH